MKGTKKNKGKQNSINPSVFTIDVLAVNGVFTPPPQTPLFLPQFNSTGSSSNMRKDMLASAVADLCLFCARCKERKMAAGLC